MGEQPPKKATGFVAVRSTRKGLGRHGGSAPFGVNFTAVKSRLTSAS